MERRRFEALVLNLGVPENIVHALWEALHTTGGLSGSVPPLDSGRTFDPNHIDGTWDASPLDASPSPKGRYTDLGHLGAGGVGEVRRVMDNELKRVVAMKTLHPERMNRPTSVARFLTEAQATAQLQHPGVIPVHEVGVLDDGRLYYTMTEIRGSTLRETLAVERQRGPVGLRRAIALLVQACDAVAYAHHRGVVHRDLKPDNIMVGSFGEVQVLDWGLAGFDTTRAEGESLSVARPSTLQTRSGSVAGTPAYMAPEQADPTLGKPGTWTDVYALGVILYEFLHGKAPYSGNSGPEVLAQLRAGPPPTLLDRGITEPQELVEICDVAMARVPEARFDSAQTLRDSLREWLDGANRRVRALKQVERSAEQEAEARALRKQADSLRKHAFDALADVPPEAPESAKAAGWELEDRAHSSERRAALLEEASRRSLTHALTIEPSLSEARTLLALAAQHRLTEAEVTRDAIDIALAEAELKSHLQALSPEHAKRRELEDWLDGEGQLTLVTEPPGAQVWIAPFQTQNRRLQLGEERYLGATPLAAHPLSPGTYRARLVLQDRPEVVYPFRVTRKEHWHGRPPDADIPTPIAMPTKGMIPTGFTYIAPGWFELGGEVPAQNCLPRQRAWCDGFIVQILPVTLAELLDWLNNLHETGRTGEAERFQPAERSSKGETGVPFFGRDATGRFILVPDAEGDTWDPRHPALMLDFDGTAAYCRWRAERDGLPWRLPSELELEKAGRGVDGRTFPWGEFADPSWACSRNSHGNNRSVPAVVDSYPIDCSPYGVRGLGGNMMERTGNRYADSTELIAGHRVLVPDMPPPGTLTPATQHTLKGGVFHGDLRFGMQASRYPFEANARQYNVSFRLACSWPPEPKG